MTPPIAKLTQTDWDSLACYLAELRDALLVTGLALRDYQFTLDSNARNSAW